MITALWSSHIVLALWQNTITAMIVLALLRVFRRSSPRLRHALTAIALLKFALPPMLPLPTGIFSAAPPVPELPRISFDQRIALALLLVHAGGVVVMLARLVLEAAKLHGIRARACNGISDEISVPMTTGILRPAILIPTTLARTLTEAELRDVIAHERQHVRQHDVLWNALQSLIVAVWWFHPLAHRLFAEARTLREECCDDALLAGGMCERGQYARTLLNAATLAAGSTPVAAAAIAESRQSLLRRIRRIADARFAPTLRLGLGPLMLVIVAALVLLPGLRVSARNRIAFDHATRHALFHHHH